MKQYTIRDIARLACVSVSTVSRVINERPDVNEATKLKVLNVIDQYHFEPNSNAKHLKQNSTNIVAIIVRGRQNQFLTGIIDPLETLIHKGGFEVIVSFIDEEANEFFTAKRLCSEKKLEGIVFLGGNAIHHQNVKEYVNVPCVFATVDVSDLDYKNVASVCVDDKSAAKFAISYLIKNGHKKIIILGKNNTRTNDPFGKRICGIDEAFEEAGIAYQDSWFINTKFTFHSGYKAAAALLKSGEQFTAIFALSDIIAIGATKAIFDASLKVPDDISVMGFDGLSMAKYYNPSIATISQSQKVLAQNSAELLLSLINGTCENRHILLPFEFIDGQSVATI